MRVGEFEFLQDALLAPAGAPAFVGSMCDAPAARVEDAGIQLNGRLRGAFVPDLRGDRDVAFVAVTSGVVT